MLTDTFLHITTKYTQNKEVINNAWLEIFSKYSEQKRHYHNTTHLEELTEALKEVKNNIIDWDTTIMAVFYHDIIYKTSSNTNEEDSAKIALERLKEMNFPEEKTTHCVKMIIATKQHLNSEDNDTNYLLDADLITLGKNPYDYQKYADNIRKEYSRYPDFIYNPGRKKILNHFLSIERIYKTNHFFDKFENQARINIKNELDELEK